MEALQYEVVQCPYCGEAIELAVDPAMAGQRYIEDCSVCCRPIELLLVPTRSGFDLQAARDDD